MSSRRVDIQKMVLKFTKPTLMKFQPIEDFQQPLEQQNIGLVTKIRNFFSPPSKPQKSKSPLKRQKSVLQNLSQVKKRPDKPSVKFVRRLTNEHILVGNEDQLDAMSVAGIVNDFVDIQFLWSLKIRKAIIQVVIDRKRNYILLLSEHEVTVFYFESKNMRQNPVKVSSVSLGQSTKHIHVMREGAFALCYTWGLQFYSIDQVKGIRKTLKKNYSLPHPGIHLYQIPKPFENILNLFFSQKLQGSTQFALWAIQVEFFEKEVKMGGAQRIYEIPGYLKETTRLQNFSKTVFLINMGNTIYAVRKGYVIDFANVSIQSGSNCLRYLSNNKLIHISDTRVELYNFYINQALYPPRIVVNSIDSLEVPQFPDRIMDDTHGSSKYEYIETVELLGQNLGIFYQLKPSENILVKGETRYIFLLTNLIKIEQKLRDVLPQDIGNFQIQRIQEKADMAKKMGMDRKEIYLRLWNNSNKTTVDDFKLLLDTLDYDTIKAEIEKKLRKISMNYREVQLIEQGCLGMLYPNVYTPNNNKQDIKNYFISDMLIRKLNLFKLITIENKKTGKAISQDPSGKLLINIQNYNYYRTVDIKTMLLEFISAFVNEDKDQINKIRLVIRQFKFALRINYQTLIAGIISNTKKNFLKLLMAIPELLPYEPESDSKVEDPALMTGIWSPISQSDWDHLHLDNVQTIDNAENLKEIFSSVWYKRYWLTQYDFVNKTRQQIQELQKVNDSEQTFYLAISKIFQFHQYSSIRLTIDFIQDNYAKMPQHIYGKIFLYKELFDHFKAHRHISKIEETETFECFLKLKDPQLFKLMFNFEKVKKGYILKEVKPIYQRLSCIQVFNEGLLHYFASPLCQISDIKYILNRLNNQKRQFHEQNKGIYEVLVRGMQLKMRLGSEADIPIDQVLIYIQNIPYLHSSSLQNQLKLMRIINEYSHRFNTIKINMTVFEIIKNMDKVIATLIHYELNKQQVLKIKNADLLKEKSRRIIEDIEDFKNRLYPDQGHKSLTLFTYICDLMSFQELLPFVAILLEDEWINVTFQITKLLIENLVIYSFNRRMREKPTYKENIPYIRELLSLLSEQSHLRQYIQAQVEVAEALSPPDMPMTYPLSGYNEYFTSTELLQLIERIPGEHTETIDIFKLFQNMKKIQTLSSDGKLSEITLPGIYEMVIIRMIECHRLKEVIPKIRQLLKLQGDSNYNFIYPALLVSKLVPEMIDENRILLLKCSSHLFRDPSRLLDILESLMTLSTTSQGEKQMILKEYSAIRFQYVNYSEQSQIIQPSILAILETDEQKKNFILLLRYSLYNLISQKQSFTRPQFFLMFVMLVNDPYVLVKYVHINRNTLNLKQIRCFLSYMIKQDLFSKTNILQFGKRMFFMIFKAVVRNKNVEELIDTFKSIPLERNIDMDRVEEVKTELEKKFALSLDRLKAKLKTVLNAIRKRKAQGSYNQQSRVSSVRIRLQNPKSKEGIYEYPFIDSDDSPHNQQGQGGRQLVKRQSILKPFDSEFQRESLMGREQDKLNAFITIDQQKKMRDLFYDRKLVRDSIYGNLTINKDVQHNIAGIADKLYDDMPTDSPRSLRVGAIHSHKSIEGPASRRFLRQIDKQQRSRNINNLTADEKMVIEKEEEEMVKSAKVSEIVGNSMGEAQLLLKIVQPSTNIREETVFNFEPLERYQGGENFRTLLQQMTFMAYKNQNMTFRGILLFIKRMNETFPELKINKEWINIYLRAQALQNKFNLQLPLRQIFTAQGLLVESEISQNLFHFLFPGIMKCLNDQNIHKLCKVINLAFRKTDLQQEILLYYLIELLKEYQTSIEIADATEQDLSRQRDKFKGIIQKIPIKYLVEQQYKLFKIFPQQPIKKQVVKIFVQSFNLRCDYKAADFLTDKYISKVGGKSKKS